MRCRLLLVRGGKKWLETALSVLAEAEFKSSVFPASLDMEWSRHLQAWARCFYVVSEPTSVVLSRCSRALSTRCCLAVRHFSRRCRGQFVLRYQVNPQIKGVHAGCAFNLPRRRAIERREH